jgi:opacity protein-like surface antigen
MKKIVVIIISVCLLSKTQAQQGELRLTVNYSVAVPAGDLKDFTPDVSPRGGELSFLYGISDKLSLGLTGSYQDFYEKYPRQVFDMGDGTDISAVLSNSVQLIPVLATVRYNFTPTARIQPYLAAGVGGNIIIMRQYFGEYVAASEDKVGFAARPEAGVFIPLSKNKLVGANLSAVYNYMPFNAADFNNLNNLAFRLGVNFPLRD